MCDVLSFLEAGVFYRIEDKDFIHYIQEQNEVREVHRVSGEGCYHLKIKVKSQEQLNLLLNDLLKYGNYSIHLSIQEIKQQTSFKSV